MVIALFTNAIPLELFPTIRHEGYPNAFHKRVLHFTHSGLIECCLLHKTFFFFRSLKRKISAPTDVLAKTNIGSRILCAERTKY